MAALAQSCGARYMCVTQFTLKDQGPMDLIVDVISLAIDILIWIIIAGVIMSWLIVLNVVNLSNQYVGMVYNLISRVTDPLLNPIRRLMPNLGGIDLSPLILILILVFIKYLLFANPGEAVLFLIITAFNVVITIVIICAILTWMAAFGAINLNNQFVYMVFDSLSRVCDPMLNPIRRFLPRVGGIDISFIVLLLVLFVLRYLVVSLI
jgi:YggT family protein